MREALDALPREVEGFNEVSFQVIDDGSEDRTVEVAREHGAEVVRLPVHRGLAVAFATGSPTRWIVAPTSSSTPTPTANTTPATFRSSFNRSSTAMPSS